MKRAIFDASFFLSFLLPDEENIHSILRQFIEGDLILIEPFIFNLEVVNGLRYAFAARRINRDKLLKTVKEFQGVKNIQYIYDFNLEKLIKTALRFDISLYDACYLYLKEETELTLYSLDRKLYRRALD